ncbi:MAG: hypothetical protein NZ920_02300 [Aigarchaeota archaeon]|nr:hypothetical protein [Aigarchaeota archaeon]MDW8092543.1 hypothetical protein [Nitrososphaerota archaeon]
MSERWVSLERLWTSELLRELAYPSKDVNYAREVLRELESSSIIEVSVCDEGLTVLGKGYRSIVVRCKMDDGVVAAKILRTDSPLRDVLHEASMQRYANEHGIGPKLFSSTPRVIVMEEVTGVDLGRWLVGTGRDRVKVARDIILELLRMGRSLDEIRLRHGELSNAKRHVIVSYRGPVIIDFSASSLHERPANLNALLNYLFYGEVRDVVTQTIGLRSPSLGPLKAYKRYHSDHWYRKILEELIAEC